MKSKYFFRKLFCIAVVFSILLIAALIPLEYNNISTLSFFDVQSSVNPTFEEVHPKTILYMVRTGGRRDLSR